MPMHQGPAEPFGVDTYQTLSCYQCRAEWCRIDRMRNLADADCPNCGAGYADVGRVGDK